MGKRGAVHYRHRRPREITRTVCFSFRFVSFRLSCFSREGGFSEFAVVGRVMGAFMEWNRHGDGDGKVG